MLVEGLPHLLLSGFCGWPSNNTFASTDPPSAGTASETIGAGNHGSPLSGISPALRRDA